MLSVFSVRRNLSILLSHTNMGFVNSHGVISIRRLDRVDMFPFMLLFRWWVPVHAIEQGVSLNLHHSPSWVFVCPCTICPLHMYLVLFLMLDPWSSIFQRFERDAKATEFVSLSSKLPSIPSVEISENCETFCSRAPLHEINVIIGLEVQTKFLVRSCNILKTTLSSLENVKPPGKN